MFVLLFVYTTVEKGRRGEGETCIKCELIGGGSPRHLNASSNLLLLLTALMEGQLQLPLKNW